MRYLKKAPLHELILTKEEEDYLDAELQHDRWCKQNQGRHGRQLHISEAVNAFKDDIYYIALELGNDELMKYIQNKGSMEFAEKKNMAKQVPIKSLITTEINQNKTICPFHNDSNASLHIYENTNSYYCFVCGCGGDTISYMQKLNGCTFHKAVNLLI